jgi:steroid Delta-isomerase
MPAPADLKPFVDYFEQLKPEDLPQLGRFYAPGVRFKDPFNEVTGLEAVAGIFGHMFDNLDGPRFEVRDLIVQGDQAFLSWDFVFRMRRFNRELQRIRGGSHLRFGSEGLITEHRDYWDAAEELYEKLPVLGGLMRWLKKRAAS